MNSDICRQNYTHYNQSWCPPVFDNWTCWPPSPPGNSSTRCPLDVTNGLRGTAYKLCLENGTWEEHTNYDDCIPENLRGLVKMCSKFPECRQITRIARIIEMVGLSFSLVSLMISLFIFFQYRVLKNNRTKIHKNLFIATLLHVVFRLIKYIDFEKYKFIENISLLQKTWGALLEYTKTAMFMWMFIEGLYLHNIITVTVFQENTYIRLYFGIGWAVPVIMTSAWFVTMILIDGDWKFYYLLHCYWILEGPRSIVIAINLLFLINIIRVLIMKLRESRIREIEQVRKAVRAAIFLLPLLGIANMLFWIDCRLSTKAWEFALWLYSSYFLSSFQGFFVAVLYCFLNGEVQTAIRNSFYLRMSLRNHDYAPCRNLTVFSTAPDPESTMHSESPGWIRQYFKQFNRFGENKATGVCHHRDSTIVTALTVMETKQASQNISRISSEKNDMTSENIAQSTV